MSLQSTTEQPFATSETLKPYVPRLAVEWLREHPGERHRPVEGTLAFTDISGFTQLTERLSRKGKVGAEEMNDLLNSCFTELLSVAYDHGAGVIKWGGDAVLLLFTGADHEARACRGALEMQKTIGTVGKRVAMPSGVKLRMSIGIHSGVIDFFLVGDLHRELVVTGPAATITVATEAVADAGQVAVTPATAAALAPGRVGEQKGDVFLLKDKPDVAEDRTPPVGDVSDIDLRRCLPVEVGAYLSTGGGDAEHRPMTAAFIHLTGADGLLESEGPDALADALESCLGSVQRIAHDHRVSFFETDVAANGVKVMLMAGAPSSAGNDEERMLRAMRAVLDDEPALPMRIGVNQGRIFVSDFGPPYRRTYSVKGDAVNLAARLMARAEPGQLLATDTVLERSRTNFETLALPPFQAKGKSEPVLAYSVGKPLRGVERGDETVLIGRKRELAMLLDGLAGARLSEGRLVEIVAEPGMGKSTLLAAAQREAPDIRTLTVQCDEYESSTPYHPLHRLLRELLELPSTDGAEQLAAALSRRAPNLLRWLPLIATALAVQAAETPETAALDDQYRKKELERTVVELLGMLLLEPTMLVFEDVHWLDDATADLISTIAEQLESRPWLVVLTRRDAGRSFAGDRVESIRLEALGEEEAAALLAEATSDRPLPPHELAELARRAGGNPLFLTELLATARSPDGLAELPDSVEALLMTQIDRLGPDDRRVLRAAAVIGASFTPELLEAADGLRLDAELQRRLADFILDEGGGRLRFRHALVRDAAYEGLPYRRRRDLHARVGDAIEVRAAEPETEAELLSLHFFSAGHLDKAWRYSCVAGKRAKDIFANVEAAAFLNRALESSRRLPISSAEIAEVSESLGDVRMRLGEFAAARASFRVARRQLANDPVERARLMSKEGTISWRLGNYTQAVRWFGRGLRELEGIEGVAAGAERARLCATTGHVRGRQGRPRQAIAWLERAINEAQTSGADDALALAYGLLDIQYSAVGELESVENSQRALAIYEELGDVERQANVLNSLGVFAYTEGRWDESIDYYERAREAWDKAGNHWTASYAIVNGAEVLSDQGRLDEAEPILQGALRVARASHSPARIADVSVHLGRLFARKGEFEQASELLNAARDHFVQVGDRVELLATEARLAESLLLAAMPDEALALADATFEKAAVTEGSSLLMPLIGRVRGCALMQLDRVDQARAALEESLSAARELRMDYEIGLTLSALVDLAERTGTPDVEARQERGAIFGRLGVVAASEDS